MESSGHAANLDVAGLDALTLDEERVEPIPHRVAPRASPNGTLRSRSARTADARIAACATVSVSLAISRPVSPLRQTARVLTADNLDVTDALTWSSGAIGSLTRASELSGGWTSTMLALATEDGEEAVLRLMTREPWRSHGPTLTTREREVQQMLAHSSVPAPRSCPWTLMVASAAFLPT